MPKREKGASSSDYRIFETEQFQKDLKVISRSGMPALESKLRTHVYPQLRLDPHWGSNVKRLKAPLSNTWRFRIGAWRFFYQIDERHRVVYLLSASHRSSAY
jgi:mRNA interferase RelE/StbE